MSGIHERMPMTAMLAPGRQKRGLRNVINMEIRRLTDREEDLTVRLTKCHTDFEAGLVVGQLERIIIKREALLQRIHPKKWARRG